MGNVPLIDTTHLDKYVMGDAVLRNEILLIFNDQAITLYQRFLTAQSDEDWMDAAHALKGSARGIGAWALGDLCEAAEALMGPIQDKANKRSAILKKIGAQVQETRLASVELSAR